MNPNAERILISGLIIGLGIVTVIAVVVTVRLLSPPGEAEPVPPTPVPTGVAPTIPPDPTAPPPTDTPVPPTSTPIPFFEGPFVIGHSYLGRELVAYRLGTGTSKRALIGGIHGGYEWNTVDLMSETLRSLQEQPALIPSNVTLYIVPCANPDGYAAGTDRENGRPNGNNVDLNRNWDYQWQMTATHGTREVFAGTHPFSEPENRAVRDLIEGNGVEAVIFYHSAMHMIFSGADRTHSATFELAEMLSEATGYPHNTEGIYGQITTGDAIDYLSTRGIAGAEIELTNHQEIDWEQNWRGVLAFLNWNLPGREQVVTYVVEPGDTLLSIARRFGTTVEATMALNDIADEDQITAGLTLLVPGE